MENKAVVINGVTVNTSDPESMYEGWLTVEKMARSICWKHMQAYGSRNGNEIEDLMQQAYITYDRVVKSYNPDISDNISTFLYCSIRDDLKYLYQTTDKTRMLEECDSLSKKHYEEEESASEDEYVKGGDAREEAEEKLQNSELKAALDEILADLDEKDKETLKKLVNGVKIDNKSKKQALKAARTAILAANDDLKAILRDYATYI